MFLLFSWLLHRHWCSMVVRSAINRVSNPRLLRQKALPLLPLKKQLRPLQQKAQLRLMRLRLPQLSD